MKSYNSSRGFTLVELLIALTLLGLVMTILYGALRVGIRSWEAGEKQAVAMDDRRLIFGFLRREIGQAYPLMLENKDKQRVAFVGGPDSFQFAAILPAHRGVGGLYLISLKRSDAKLVFSYRLAQPGGQGLQAGAQKGRETSVALVNALKQVEFSYYGKQGKGSGKNIPPRWWRQWKDPARLPKLIRMTLRTSDSLDPWPEIVVPVHAEVHADEPQFRLGSSRNVGGAGVGDVSEDDLSGNGFDDE
jgi:general secretion pathway protein J